MEKQPVQYDLTKFPNYKEYLWYKEHEEELMRRYYGRFIVIKDGQVIGDYGSRKLARQQTVKHHKPGTYLIHQCVEPDLRRAPRLNNHQLVTIDGK